MAMQPIDLQTLFTQLDKVGKLQANLKEGAQLQQSLQAASNQKKAEERVRSVNETHDAGEGADRVKDKAGRRGAESGGEGRKRQGDSEEPEEKESAEVVRDPDLGKNIDVSG